MTLSNYHKKYTKLSDEEIWKRADVKESELKSIFEKVSLDTKSDPVRIAVLGCGDKRFVAHHKRIFENQLRRSVEVTTLDITVEHLEGEGNIFQHDCTMPIPNPPYDMCYAHVLLKFIEMEKQWEVLKK